MLQRSINVENVSYYDVIIPITIFLHNKVSSMTNDAWPVMCEYCGMRLDSKLSFVEAGQT